MTLLVGRLSVCDAVFRRSFIFHLVSQIPPSVHSSLYLFIQIIIDLFTLHSV